MKETVLDNRQLQDIEQQTLRHYDESYLHLWSGTKDHDVSQNGNALLRHTTGGPPFRILDLGCGGGRDLIAFRAMNHEAIGLDGSSALCDLARRNSGCKVWHQNFLALDLPAAHFDGIFANASLFFGAHQKQPAPAHQKGPTRDQVKSCSKK